jgi:methanogenic corrinoid protein MtbC1
MAERNGRSQDLIDAISSNRVLISRTVVESTYRDLPHLWDTYGKKGRRLCMADMDFHLSYLIESLSRSDPSLFLDYLRWVKGLFDNMGLPANSVPDLLDRLGAALRDMFPKEFSSRLVPFLDFADEDLSAGPGVHADSGGEKRRLNDICRNFTHALLRRDKRSARELILKSIEQGIPIQDIYLHVFQPSQREIGRLWYTRRIGVAEEHFFTAVTQLIMSELYPYVFSADKSGRRMVAACAEGEMHEIGIRMVADFFEMEGWETLYLGANMPNGDIVRTIEETRPDILAISATLSLRHSTVERLITEVRAASLGDRVKIIVGGVDLGRRPDLCRKLGADACGADARAALRAAESLLGPIGR